MGALAMPKSKAVHVTPCLNSHAQAAYESD